MERRSALLTICGLLGTLGIGLVAIGMAMSDPSVWFVDAGWVLVGLSFLGALAVLFSIPKEKALMSGNGPKNVNNGPNHGIVGDVSGSTVNIGPRRFELTAELVKKIVENCPDGRPVMVVAVGNLRALSMQAVIVQALTAAGFAVTTDSAMMTLPAPERPLEMVAGTTQTIITIAPDVLA